MDDARVVRMPERLREGREDGERAREGQTFAHEDRIERLPLDVLEREVALPLPRPVAVDPDDAGVRELGDVARLVREPRRDLGVLGDLGVEELERDPAPERLLDGLVDDAHASATELADHFEILDAHGGSVPPKRRKGARRVGAPPGWAGWMGWDQCTTTETAWLHAPWPFRVLAHTRKR